MHVAHGLVTAAVTGLVLAGLSCAQDPVHDRQVTALGAEVPGVPEGPYHRAGQPCTVCHGAEGPAATQFSLAGTVFNGKASLVGVENAQILLVDATGSSPTAPVVTNCVGNFYVTADTWNPAFPILVGIQSGAAKTQMLTQISRASSCAECHTDPQGIAAAGHVFIDVSVNPNQARRCPVSPNAGGDGGVP